MEKNPSSFGYQVVWVKTPLGSGRISFKIEGEDAYLVDFYPTNFTDERWLESFGTPRNKSGPSRTKILPTPDLEVLASPPPVIPVNPIQPTKKPDVDLSTLKIGATPSTKQSGSNMGKLTTPKPVGSINMSNAQKGLPTMPRKAKTPKPEVTTTDGLNLEVLTARAPLPDVLEEGLVVITKRTGAYPCRLDSFNETEVFLTDLKWGEKRHLKMSRFLNAYSLAVMPDEPSEEHEAEVEPEA